MHNAGYQAGHHDGCLRGTRESGLDGIMRWAKDSQERRVFWLNGLAGIGKSTIAQTFSQIVAEDGTLGASFFCSRDYLNRRELKNIFPTLAHQLACRYPSFRSQIIGVVKKNPSVARFSHPLRGRSLRQQAIFGQTLHHWNAGISDSDRRGDFPSPSWNPSLRSSCYTGSNCPVLTRTSGCTPGGNLMRPRS